MKYLGLMLITLISFGCLTHQDKIEKSNKCYKAQFTQNEFSELEGFLDKFESFLRSKIEEKEINEIYKGYFDLVKKNGEYGMDSIIVQEIIKEITEPTKDKIWYLSDGFIKASEEPRKLKEKKFLNISEEFKSQLSECNCIEKAQLEKLKVSVHFSKLEKLYNSNKRNIHLNFPLRLYFACEIVTRVKNSYD